MKTEFEDSQIIEQLYKDYGGIIYSLSLKILKDNFLAQDAVQETFLNAFRALSSFTYGDSYLPWLYRIGTNVCLKTIRNRKNNLTSYDVNLDNENKTAYEPGERLDARKTIEKLSQKLDEKNMDILILHYICGINQTDVADMIGISRRAVVKRLNKLKTIAEDIEETI
ncbi:MAG: sigma-70 family RNA polymerase sigma factor [Deltaproteobacteria bacterium]|nr:sigma-70 family RNA polymerase sigma factor [Deltaproteobacteria bacterium]